MTGSEEYAENLRTARVTLDRVMEHRPEHADCIEVVYGVCGEELRRIKEDTE